MPENAKSSNPGRLYIAKIVRDQQQDKQGNRKADAHRQGTDGPIALPLVFHQKEKSRSKAANNQHECDGDNNFHDKGKGIAIHSRRAASEGTSQVG